MTRFGITKRPRGEGVSYSCIVYRGTRGALGLFRARKTRLFFKKNERRPTNVGQSKFFLKALEITIIYSLKENLPRSDTRQVYYLLSYPSTTQRFTSLNSG